jgi:ribosomal-protein-alanine acetyltransferase
MSKQSYSGPLEQIDAVLAIEEASFTNPWTREMYLAELENPGVSYCFLANDAEGRPIGFCSFWRVLDELHINNLAVIPGQRRTGVASALLTFVLDEGARLGARRATLEVRRSNDPARYLYEHFGFTVTGVRRGYYTRPVEVRDMEFLRRSTGRKAKITLPGPFTMTQQAKNEFYKDQEELAMDFAVAVNEEARDLQKAGADVIQLDEPWLRNDPEGAKRYAIKAINRALEGITVPTVVHLCFGYAFLVKDKPTSYFFLSELADSKAQQISIESAQPKIDLGVLKDLSAKKIMLGVINLGDPIVERGEQVAERIRAGLKHVAPDRLIPAPDCGMKYMTREVAFGKLKALAEGAAMVRRELS